MGKCRVASANGTSSSQHRTMSKPKQTVKLIVRSKGEPTKTRRAHSESSQKFFSNHRVAPVLIELYRVSYMAASIAQDTINPLFFVAGAIVFRLVTTLEAYLRTSGESNHHR